MDEATLERMANFIIENANKLERYGLVDYQMGVAEEEIIASEWSYMRILAGSELMRC
jgi:hypothetical protein